MKTENKKSILIDKNLHNEFKIYCAKNGLFMNIALEELILDALDSQI
jgi:hypothetical protein